VRFIGTRELEKNTFPEWGLPTARPKEEDVEEWPGATAALYHPAAVGSATGPAAADRHLVARLPKFSGAVKIAARYCGWSTDESASQLALALEGTAVQALLDLAQTDQRDLQALTRALERHFGQRVVMNHSRELLFTRRRREGERLGAYAADVQLYAQPGLFRFPCCG
jgi:hypothetical protein